MKQQPTCEDRVKAHLESRLEDLMTYFQPDESMVCLEDDGTLDAVLSMGDIEWRYSDTSDYRDEDTGEFDLDAFLEDNFDDFREEAYERFAEYGLCFDYVAPDTFNGQEEGYFRYQLSWGGPGDEFRFYTCGRFDVYKIEYWFLDWFDGACRTLQGKDFDLLNEIFEDFKGMGSVEHVYDEAVEY